MKELLENFTVYMEETVFLNLAKLYYPNHAIQFKDKQYLEFLEKLRQTEIEMLSQVARQTFLNRDHEGYFTAEIPLGMTFDDRPYTYQSYKRNTAELSNYVLHVMGHYDEGTGAVTLFNQCTRAANYVPIKLPSNRVEKLRATWAQVWQRHVSVQLVNPRATTFSQISLLSPLAEGPNAIDTQEGHEQTLLTYLAFLLQNQHNKRFNSGMQLRYFVEGVNQMRFHLLSHPLRSQINTRFYNQLMDDLKIKSNLCKKIFSLDKREEEVKNSWENILTSINNLNAHLKKPNFDDNALAGFIQVFEINLAQHCELEKKLYHERIKAWAKHKKQRTEFLQANKDNQTHLVEYNLIQEFNNLHFLRENHTYQKRDYNYQLPACVHRLTASLGHEVGVNCNDSKDRTGFENVVIMATYQFMHKNKGRAPNLQNKKTLKMIQQGVKAQQMKDVGIKNTEANGAAGQEINPNDVAPGMVNETANQVAKLSKLPYRTILKGENWKEQLKNLSTRKTMETFGNFIKQKIRVGRWIKKAAKAILDASVAFFTRLVKTFAGFANRAAVQRVNEKRDEASKEPNDRVFKNNIPRIILTAEKPKEKPVVGRVAVIGRVQAENFESKKENQTPNRPIAKEKEVKASLRNSSLAECSKRVGVFKYGLYQHSEHYVPPKKRASFPSFGA